MTRAKFPKDEEEVAVAVEVGEGVVFEVVGVDVQLVREMTQVRGGQ